MAKLLKELPIEVPVRLIEEAKFLDAYYVPTRYPDAFAEGIPAEHYLRRRSAMPVRSLTSSVRKWPSPGEVEAALGRWAKRLDLPGLVALGYFGSYARGDAGVGSDLDLVVVVEASDLPPPLRATRLPLEDLPVPADALVYTRAEWEALKRRKDRFAKTLLAETRWLLGPP